MGRPSGCGFNLELNLRWACEAAIASTACGVIVQAGQQIGTPKVRPQRVCHTTASQYTCH